MGINLLVIAIPFFLLLMGVEYLVSLRGKESIYALPDFVNNLSCGILEQVFCLPLGAFLIFSYDYLYQNHALFQVNTHSPFVWMWLWIGTDFLYYWFHRASHRNNLLWIGHSVHHQSEHYNLSVALRQGIGQTLFSWIIYLPLACIGFPTGMFLIISSLITLYQFWIHTKIIKGMGWFELIFNTPSHHRVHHGKNPQYIDKNFGGSLILWDKLFGTYEKEGAPVEYGTTEPLNSWNPFYANVKVIVDLFYYSHSLNSLKKRLGLLFRPPEWIIQKIGHQQYQILKKTPITYAPVQSPSYMLINLFLMIVGYLYLLIYFTPSSLIAWLLSLLIFLTLYILGSLLTFGRSAHTQAAILVCGLILSLFIHLIGNHYLIDAGALLLFFSFHYKTTAPLQLRN